MYRYYCIAYPPMLCGLIIGRRLMALETFDERRYVPEIDRMAWGWLEYAEPLTPMEISEYKLISAPREVECDE